MTRQERRRPRSVLALALLAVTALVLSSCASAGAWIARVDGTTVDTPHFWQGVEHYAALLSGGQPPMEGTQQGVAPMPMAAQYALFLVQLHAIGDLNDDLGVEVTDAALEQQRQAIEASPQADLYEDLPDWFVDQIVEAGAAYEALITHFGQDADIDAQVEDYYEANADQFTQLCLDMIPGEEATLMAAKQRLAEGTDFATVAQAVAAEEPATAEGVPAQALGDNADGDVGCVDASVVSTMFSDPSQVAVLTEAEPDEVVGPIPVAGGFFMLFRVRSVETQSLDEVRGTIEQSISQPGQQEAAQALDEFILNADIELNPRLGSWTNGVGYAPPEGAELPPGQTTVPVMLSDAAG